MRFKPVYLGFADRTVRKLHSGEALHFPPTRRCRICGPDNVGCAPPARCDALNISHLAKDLKCCRQPSPLAVIDLCRACSALAFSEFKRGRLSFSHLHPLVLTRRRTVRCMGWLGGCPSNGGASRWIVIDAPPAPTTQDIASRSRCLIPARKRRNQR